MVAQLGASIFTVLAKRSSTYRVSVDWAQSRGTCSIENKILGPQPMGLQPIKL